MSITAFLKNAEKIERHEAKISEKTIEKKFVKAAEKLGFKAFKLALIGLRGFPDRTVVGSDSRIFFVEFKTETGKLSASQVVFKDILEKFGFRYYVCNSLGQIDRILQDNFLDQYRVKAGLQGEDPRYPTLILSNDDYTQGYDVDPVTLELSRICICSARYDSECVCGACDL